MSVREGFTLSSAVLNLSIVLNSLGIMYPENMPLDAGPGVTAARCTKLGSGADHGVDRYRSQPRMSSIQTLLGDVDPHGSSKIRSDPEGSWTVKSRALRAPPRKRDPLDPHRATGRRARAPH